MKSIQIFFSCFVAIVLFTSCTQIDTDELDSLTDLTAHLYCLYLKASFDSNEESIEDIIAATPQIIIDFGFTEEEFLVLLDRYESTRQYEELIIRKIPKTCPQEYNFAMEI